MSKQAGEISGEMLREFAVACGWTSFQSYGNGGGFWHRDGCTKRARNSSCGCGGHFTLPNFLHSKDAVIEALEWFVEHRFKDAERRYQAVRLPNGQHGIQLGWSYHGEDKTLNAAIILAVLAASKREGR